MSSITSDKYVIIDGAKTTNASTTGYSNILNIYLFCINNAGAANNFSKIRIAYWRAFDDNNTMVRDFIPVLDWNEIPCLFDKVTRRFFYNSGSGQFNYA